MRVSVRDLENHKKRCWQLGSVCNKFKHVQQGWFILFRHLGNFVFLVNFLVLSTFVSFAYLSTTSSSEEITGFPFLRKNRFSNTRTSILKYPCFICESLGCVLIIIVELSIALLKSPCSSSIVASSSHCSTQSPWECLLVYSYACETKNLLFFSFDVSGVICKILLSSLLMLLCKD